jgi:uncharacterized membrane protein
MLFTDFVHHLRRSHDRLMPLLAIALALGLMLRMYHPALKYYQHDEVITALRISGQTEQAFIEDLVRHPGMTLGDIEARYQRYSPDRSIGATLNGIAQEEPQLTPLYYGLVHYWAGIFGDDRGRIRQLSTLFSLLTLPVLVWLAWELFRSWQVPLLAVGLFAVSPFHTLFAQQARHYSLWALTILLCSAALLRALRRDRPLDWLGYGLALALSLYSGLLTVLVAVGHGLYLLVWVFGGDPGLGQRAMGVRGVGRQPWGNLRQNWQQQRGKLGRYLLASIGGVLLFMPWALILTQNWSRVRQATGVIVGSARIKPPIAPWGKLFIGWFRAPVRLFYDANVWSGSPQWAVLSQTGLSIFVLCLIAYAVYRLWRSYDRRVTLFLYTAAIVPWAGLVIQDRVLGVRGGQGSITQMYLMPTMLALGLIVASALAYHLRPQSQPGWPRRLAQGSIAILLTAGLVSNIWIARSDWWVNQGFPEKVLKELATAQIINRSDRPLLVSDPESWEMLFFSHLLKPETQVIMNPRCGLCNMPDKPGWQPDLSDRSAQTIFAFPNPSEELRRTLQQDQGLTLEPLLESQVEPHLYRGTPAVPAQSNRNPVNPKVNN